MPTTYTDPSTIERDAVRLLIRDTDTTNAFFTDEELDALISFQLATGTGRKYYAAAAALEIVIARMVAAREDIGVRRKKVSRLELEWGADRDTLVGLRNAIKSYREQGGRRTARGSVVFRVMPAGTRVVDPL